MALPVIVGAVAKVGGAILAEKAIDKAIDVGSNSLKNRFSAMKERCEVNQENYQKRLTGEYAQEQVANTTLDNQEKVEITETLEAEQVNTMRQG